MKIIIAFFKRAFTAVMRSREERALYYVAQQLQHEYPNNTVDEIAVALLRNKIEVVEK